MDDNSLVNRSYRRNVSPPSRLMENHVDSRGYPNFETARLEPSLRTHFKPNYYDDQRESSFKTEIFDLQSKISNKEARITELEMELRKSQEIDEQQAKTMKHMQQRIEQLERDNNKFDNLRSKEGLTIATLQTDNRQLQDRVVQLEDRIRRAADDNESTKHSAINLERNYEELKHFLCKSVFPDTFLERSHESLMRRLKEFVAEDEELRGRLRKLEDNLASTDDELQRNRETIRKLLEDLDRTKKYMGNTDIIKQERDVAMQYQDNMKTELRRMEERLLRTREEWENAQYEIRQQQAKLAEAESVLKKHELGQYAASTEFKAFKETIATLLNDGYTIVSSTEDAIKDRIRSLMMRKQDIDKVSADLEQKLMEVSKQLEEQAHLHKSAVQRARKAEAEMERMRQQLKGAEGELVATDILKDGLKSEKAKYQEFLKQMADVMKMDEIVSQLGIEINGDALLLRAEQLAKTEEQLMGKKTVEMLGMQRQLKEAKKIAEERDMRMDLMKRKLEDTEISAERDWEDLIETNKRLNKQVEKLARQVHEHKTTIQAMKAESVENKALKITNEEARKTIHDLERKVSELDSLRAKQARRIAGLKLEKDQTQMDANHGFNVTETTMQSLSNEVQRLKRMLEDSQKREKQLSDLRQVIARMLGLDVNRLAVPDFEIISRLEKLIEAQNEMALNFNPYEKGSRGISNQMYPLEAQQKRHKTRTSNETPTSQPRRWK